MSAILLLLALFASEHFVAGKDCKQKVDLCFSVDRSTSVCGKKEPCENWRLALNFTKTMVSAFDIGRSASRVALVAFGEKCETQWDLTRYTKKDQLLSAIDKVPFTGGQFNDPASTQVFYTEIFNRTRHVGDRYSVKNCLLIISDGVEGINLQQSQDVGKKIQSHGITVFVVCIQTACPEWWAKATASSPKKTGGKTYFLVKNYASLASRPIQESVLDEICHFLGRK